MRHMNFKNFWDKRPVFLAPMASGSDLTFRRIASNFGADATVTEMASAKALSFGDKKSIDIIKLEEGPHLKGIQLFGGDARSFLEALPYVLNQRPDFIDINMGCPVPKIAGSGSGSALMKRPDTAFSIVHDLAAESPVPVSVKIRSGYTEATAVEFSKMLESAGAAFLTIHARTKTQMYRGKADRSLISELKRAVKIPVVANGDVYSAEDAEDMLNITGADAVMIGRAALGNPFIFREIKNFRETGGYEFAGTKEKTECMKDHVFSLCREKNEKIGMLEARGLICHYIKGIPGAAGLRREASGLKTLHDFENFLSKIE